ncbi:Os01g0739100 [Oryza sativa Japonica Group]|uniref:Os01g0739100 protein n=2 Tax=Oryza TaxID=4527 RepID=A0A0P0V807_ORYSJ|nr:Os01g0739100 [Oryza sativa Japonica Group]
MPPPPTAAEACRRSGSCSRPRAKGPTRSGGASGVATAAGRGRSASCLLPFLQGLPNLPPLRVSSSAPVTPPLSSPTASQAPKIRKPD